MPYDHLCHDLDCLEGRLLKEGKKSEASAIRSLIMMIAAMDTESQIRDASAHEWTTYETLEEYAQQKWTMALRAWAKSQNCTLQELAEVF